ncbi:unnamed protein product [Rhizoctonia solani]|uniref:PPIase cyclophilin-type domain-containing protein n=1 Tax=Rhizoctonia solani TaxID=456999 RepID=A0A8H2XSU8_9AGAM|nr:unnamed protein product [Rhizoctonia solani]
MTTQGELLNAYGSVCKLKGPLWEDQLWTSDPRAMHEILVKSHQRFQQPGSIITWINLLIGPNILTVTGHQHQTQRKILNPAFKADHMRNELLELKLQAQGEKVGVLDVYKWLNAAALEVMGQAGFGYSFDALEPNLEGVDYLNASHKITTLMLKLWFITPALPWLMKFGSRRFRRVIVNSLPFGPIRALRDAVDILNDVAVKVYRIKKEESDNDMLDSGEHLSRDVMSSLLLQNNIVAPEEAMDEEEVISQVNALILAAHDSTSAALARTIHVLADHPDVQSKLREEVCEAHEMFGEELDYDQLNSLPYLDAVCRESLRLYAPAMFLVRIAQEDWTIPLLYPGKSSDGQETITHILVKKGTCIHLSLDAANRDVFNTNEPSRVADARYLLTPNDLFGWSTRLHMPETPFLDLFSGDKDQFASESEAYTATVALLSSKAATYGLPSAPEELDEEQQGILSDLSSGATLRFRPPHPLCIGRLVFDLDTSAGLTKTCTNFISLCKGDKGMCKSAPNKPLHYKATAIHRVARDFVAQGGDVTRNDGSGGESIYGGKFSDAKEGLRAKPEFGSLAMANSGKNSNTSQFFVVLTNDPAKLAKIAGKYVIFGKARITGEGEQVLKQLGALAGADERPLRPVWVESCGVLS